MRAFIDYVLAIVAIFLVFPSISAQDNNGYNNDYEYGDNGYSNDYEYGYEQEDNLYYDYAERQQQKKYVFFFWSIPLLLLTKVSCISIDIRWNERNFISPFLFLGCCRTILVCVFPLPTLTRTGIFPQSLTN